MEAGPNVWFVRSQRPTCESVARQLGILNAGIVTSPQGYHGALRSQVVDAVAGWQAP